MSYANLNYSCRQSNEEDADSILDELINADIGNNK